MPPVFDRLFLTTKKIYMLFNSYGSIVRDVKIGQQKLDERVLSFDTQKLTNRAFLLHLIYPGQLKEREISLEDLPVLFYVRELDMPDRADVNALPTWSGLSHDLKVGIDTLLKLEAVGQRSISEVAQRIKRFYVDGQYRSQILAAYREKFKPFCDYVNARR